MQNIVLVVHLLLALLLIGAVLLQRSEGGALGIGGGGNVMSGRSTATALQKATWGLAAAFIVTSLTLTFFAIEQARDRGLGLGQGTTPAVESGGSELPNIGDLPGGDVLPGASGGDASGSAPEPEAEAEETPPAGGVNLPPASGAGN